ncbi:hydroxypyruvate isomerase [Cryobacterium roopkundense]|uniref:Hydroxypyruvate isomerase n=1 Tax=Cryobacterium roopkundense TaxID=1001240 RepID=A0A099IZS2_9MICO|nr:TIM barrel protein [Cryobacterium roopkundense]KGJ71649.1 hydroxypyruvate isomerase [Cryobacterium roopkundense]MBB5639957.1 hydroxypyruvate isomerase [Cryobacterium roopkundense]
MPYTVNCSILLTELPLLERPAAARAAGFDAVEFWWPFPAAVPTDAEVTAFECAITDAGVRLTGLNFAAGDMPAGDRGLVSWPARSAEFRDNLAVVTGIGGALGCTGFNALYGNRVDESTPEVQDALALENLALAADAVAPIGGTVLLEPVSGAPRYPLLTADDVLAVIAQVTTASGYDNVKLLADFYHLTVNGDDVAAVIAEHAAEFGHIQIADAPGRGEPGTGALPLAHWIEQSRTLGYTGPVGLEYKTTAVDPFAWLAPENDSKDTP